MSNLEKLDFLADYFYDEMIKYIVECWDYKRCGEKGMSREDAEIYLGHSLSNMTREDIDEEVSEVQKGYYSEGKASVEDVLEMFLKMTCGRRK